MFLLALASPAAAWRADTAALQVALRAKGLYGATIDGVHGPQTAAAVRSFQARRGLAVDGIAGPRTRRALGWRGRPSLGRRTLHAGQRGWDVAALQFLLGRHGFPSGPMDGGLGARTDAALRRFQSWAGLGADGLAGPATLARLRGPVPTSPLIFAVPVQAPASATRSGRAGTSSTPASTSPSRPGRRARGRPRMRELGRL